MTISLTKEEINLIKNWIHMEYADGCVANPSDDMADLRETTLGLEKKIEMSEMKESLKKVTKRLNKKIEL